MGEAADRRLRDYGTEDTVLTSEGTLPDIETLVIAGCAWAGLSVLAVALCTAAGRADGTSGGSQPRLLPVRKAAPPPLVADVGGLRAQLEAAARLLDSARLTVTVRHDGAETVLATTRAVALVHGSEPPSLTVPIVRRGHEVARLRAVRRQDARPFDAADRQLLEAVAARVSVTMEVADPSSAVSLGRHGAMA